MIEIGDNVAFLIGLLMVLIFFGFVFWLAERK